MKVQIQICLLAVISSAAIHFATAAEPDADRGFEPLFDGKSLTGWETPDPTYWSVEDGAITARISREHPCSTNQYLVWRGGELADFELKLQSRVRGEGGINNGFQFRSRLLPDHDVCGYQVDNNLKTPWLVRLYDEYGRHDLAMPGERATFNSTGKRSVEKTQEPGPAPFRLEEWHEYHLICVGPHITLRVNGSLLAEVQDNDPRRRELQGILALQLHSGPPTVAQFKDIRIKILKKPENTLPQKAADSRAVFHDALAHWFLDSGGHGALPPLHTVPAFYQFELNVKAGGAGAIPDAKVAVLDGAHFDAGTTLHATGEQVTVYLRARDPRGQWNGGLFAKRGGHDRVHFNLFSTDLPGTSGPDIGFEIRTGVGFSMVSFPVSKIDATAWHNLVGRYDGKHLGIYCDGKLMAETGATGILVTNSEPLLIGAETDNGKVVRHFHGEVQEAAIWQRALTEEEIRAPNP